MLRCEFTAQEVGSVLRGELSKGKCANWSGGFPNVGDVIIATADSEDFAELEVCSIDNENTAACHFGFKLSKVLSTNSLSARDCWQQMVKDAIPSKNKLHPLFYETILALSRRPDGVRILDLGCGDGSVVLQLSDEIVGLGGSVAIVGMDVNAEAVSFALDSAAAKQKANATFIVGDICAADLTSSHAPFDVILCQLVISVIGGIGERKVRDPFTCTCTTLWSPSKPFA